MAKVKERKSESWKPGVHHDDGFISKNKKRKDKRMSLNLSAKKIDTDEFIPIKKSFPAFNKSKDGLGTTPSKFLSPALERKQTPKKKDTPLPTSGKKQDAASNMRKFSLSHISKELNGGSPNIKKEPFGTPKGKAGLAGTPKSKTEPFGTPKIKLENTTPKSKPTPAAGTPKASIEPVIKSALKKKAQKFIDHEAEQGEEPITDKEVKPYVKGAAKKRKSITFQSPIDDVSDSSDSDESDDDEMTSARDFLDSEASEGEETDDGEIDEQDSDDDDDDDDSDAFDFMTGDDDDDELDEEDSDEDGEEEEDDEDDSDEPDSDESDDQAQLPKIQANKKPDPKAQAKKTVVERDSDEDDSDDEIEEHSSKQIQSIINQIKKQIPEKPAPKAAPQPTANQIKKEKIEKTPKVNEPAAKKPKVENLKEQKATEDETPAASEYAGYIKFLPNTITAAQIKSQLATQISPDKIVSIVLKKNNTKKSNKCLVYVTDEDTLDKLENKTYTIGETKFKVFKARESKKPEKNTPLAFLPRVPLTIDNDKIKSIIEADIGAGNVKTLKSKKTNEKLQTRNVIIEVANEDILKKIIYKGSYTCNGTDLVVRQAFESGFQIPIYKIVFSGVPENTTEALIKKAVEMKIGKGSVMAVKFSFRKKSFAFVTLNNEQAQKKLLDSSAQVTINGTKLQTLEFKPRVPKTKRGPAKKKPQGAPPAKKQKIDPKSSAENKPKKAPKPDVGAGSPAKKQQQQQNSQQQNKPKQQAQNNAQASPQQQQNNQSSKKQNKQKQQQQKKQNQQQQPGSPQQQQQKKQNQQQNQKSGSPQQQQQKKQKQQQQQQKSGSPQQQQKPKQQQQQQPGSNQSSPKKNKNKKAKNKSPNQNQPQTPDKKANLSNKLEAKKEKLKNKKNKKKQADTSI
ncbi:nucleolin-like [Planococcus citri]|uniref:nucleolin-like n=1 Tax=Planococcus citri TaxID=170843 RepID=UPI0031F884C5